MPLIIDEVKTHTDLLIKQIYGHRNYTIEDCLLRVNDESGNLLNYACCYHLYDIVEYLVSYKIPIFQSKYVKDPLSILIDNYQILSNEIQSMNISDNSIELEVIYHQKLSARLLSVERLIKDIILPYYLESLTYDLAKEYMQKSINHIPESLEIKSYITSEVAFLENDDLYVIAGDSID